MQSITTDLKAQPRFMVSAAHKSSGKTTLSIGLCAALRARSYAVRPYKKGPDYIDPMWLSEAAAHPCHTLDTYLSGPASVHAFFARRMAADTLAVVEGNKGLYDGIDLDGENSNAALAKLLKLPVVLVIDARGMTRGVAPLLIGYRHFDPEVPIAGVILNRVGGRRHESKLRAVIERYTDVPVLGAVQEDADIALTERHLGLIPANEFGKAQSLVNLLAVRVADQVNLDAIVDLAHRAPPLVAPREQASTLRRHDGVRIGIAQDRAFGFYYPDDLDEFRRGGATLVPIDLLNDSALPELDGLFIGGGFPESFAATLSANQAMRASVRLAIEGGLPTYAECGGLMYLSRSLSVHGVRHDMVGAVPADTVMTSRPVGRGYVELETDASWPFARIGTARQGPAMLRAHEFHYSRLENIDPAARFAYRVRRGHGITGDRDGYLRGNLLASYSHLRSAGGTEWVAGFLDWVRRSRGNQFHQPALSALCA
jgi:cobyrinic acid a,c-diamide synthase